MTTSRSDKRLTGSEARLAGSKDRHTGSGRMKSPALEARYDDHFGAAIDFSMETERKILKALGRNMRTVYIYNFKTIWV